MNAIQHAHGCIIIPASELADLLRRVATLEARLGQLEAKHAELDVYVTDGEDNLPSLAAVSKFIDRLADELEIDLSLEAE